jgi:hypothetical protein
MKYFSPLSLKDCLCLVGVFILGFGWLLIDQFFFSTVSLRFLALIIILLSLFYIQFRINSPENVFHYVNSITLVALAFIVLISLIIHVLINNDFTFKSILIWLVTATIPYLAGYIYLKSRKNI